MKTISVKPESGKMDCFLKTLRLVESLEKRLGNAATADDRASFPYNLFESLGNLKSSPKNLPSSA